MTPSKLLGIPENFSEHGGSVDQMMDTVHYLMFALFIGWTIFFFFCLWKFRAGKSPKASYHGVRNHVSSHIEVAVVIVEAVLLFGFAYPLWAERTDTYEIVQQRDPVRARIIGFQFGWNYHYPGEDGKFGRIDRKLVSYTGDPCIDPNDVNGWDDFLSPTLKLPVERPAILQVTSTDVIHNYHIVPMRIQQDALPSEDIPMWFTPLKKMETFAICGQLCGEGHSNMRGIVEIIGQDAFAEWYTSQSQAALQTNQAKMKAKKLAELSVAKDRE